MLIVRQELRFHSLSVLSAEPVSSLEPRREREVTEPLWSLSLTAGWSCWRSADSSVRQTVLSWEELIRLNDN